jgi:ABC-2 type transport system ATP-binding protein
MILGLVLATRGRIELFGEPMPRAGRRVLRRVGTLVEGPAAYGHLSARANLELLDASGGTSGRSTRRRRIEAALEEVGLSGVGRKPVKAYSLGMRQRLGLAAALLPRPELLVLDEPTNGLDPQGIREVRELLLRLNAAGTTIFLSSHLLAEVEQMCTRVGVLDRGRLVVQDDLANLRAPTGRTLIRTPDVAAAVVALDGRVDARDGDRLVVRASDPAALNALLVARGVPITELVLERHSLEDIVLERTEAGSDRVMPP